MDRKKLKQKKAKKTMITIKIPIDEFMEMATNQLNEKINKKITKETAYRMKYYENRGEEVEIMKKPNFIEFYIET